MRGITKLVQVQFKLFLREPAAFFFTLIFPAMLLLLFGAIFGNDPDPQFNPDFGYIDMQVPGMAAIIIGTVGLMGIPVATANAREQGVLRRYRATPLHPAAYLVADVVVYFGTALAGMVILILLAKVLYGLRFGGDWWSVSAAFVLSALAFIAVGYLIAGLASTARVAQVVGQIVFFPMMFLSGAAMPREIMPETVRRVSDALPLTYVVNLLQGLWRGEGWGDHLFPATILIGMLIVGAAVSSRVFRWE